MAGNMCMADKRRRTKYESLRDELRGRISSGEYPVGGRMPSVRELSRTFSVSTVTALRSIQELAREELVICHNGSRGTTVVRREPPTGRAVKRTTLACLLRPHNSPRNRIDNFGLDVMEGIRSEISAQGYRFVYHCPDEVDYERRMLELAREEWIAGVILDTHIPASTVQRLAQSGVPVVLFNRFQNVENVSVVTLDHEQVGREGFRILLERGYERIGFYYTPHQKSEKYMAWFGMYEGFLAAAKAEGFPPDKLTIIPEVHPKDPVSNMPGQFGFPVRKGRGWRSPGIIASSDTLGKQLVDVIAKTDLALGRDIGVIGRGDAECNAESERRFSTWTVDRHALGAEVVKELIARIEDPTLPRCVVKIRMEFVDRGTA